MKGILNVALASAICVVPMLAHADSYKFVGEVYSHPVTMSIYGVGTVGAGELHFSDTSVHPNTSFQTYCDDLNHQINSGQSYTYDVHQVTDQLSVALGNIIAGAKVTNAYTSAALQLAIWTYEYNPGSTFNDQSNNLYVSKIQNLPKGETTSDFLKLAAADYANYDVNAGEKVFQLDATKNCGGQGQIYIQSAPEPMSMGALAVGLVGLVSRRRKRA